MDTARAPRPAGAPPESAARELAWGAALLLAGILPRLAVATFFPTEPISDFRGLIDFALYLRDQGLAAPGYFWGIFNPGLPVTLSALLRVSPVSPEATARLATALFCGSMPVLPFAIWRGVQPWRIRLLAGGLLALWPGQVLFSGVPAQDNWTLPPTVALAAVAARALAPAGRPLPVAAGLLWALAGAMRQELLLALSPLLAAGSGLASRGGRTLRNALLCALAAAPLLLALAVQRGLATGHYRLSSGHGGYTVLGSFSPGSSESFWHDPLPYVVSVRPELWRDLDEEELRRGLWPLALAEARRRPLFHAARILAAALKFPLDSEVDLLYWSLLAPGVQPPARTAAAATLANRAGPLLRLEMLALQALFLAAAILAVVRRDRAILALCLAVALKAGLHLVLVVQGRFFLTVTAMELVAIALAAAWVAPRRPARLAAAALAAGLAAALAARLLGPPLLAAVRTRDVDGQRTYRFTLATWGREALLHCVVGSGRLTNLEPSLAGMMPLDRDPDPGERALAECRLTGTGLPFPAALAVDDPYAAGGLPGRMVQRVTVDGRQVFAHDLAAEPGTGWAVVPLGTVARGTQRRVSIEVAAVRPDPGAGWGWAAKTQFRLALAPGEGRTR